MTDNHFGPRLSEEMECLTVSSVLIKHVEATSRWACPTGGRDASFLAVVVISEIVLSQMGRGVGRDSV